MQSQKAMTFLLILTGTFLFSFSVFSEEPPIAVADKIQADSEEEPRLEGILYDAANPDESIIVVNGEYVKKGELIGFNQIVGVSQKYIQVRNIDTGKTSMVLIKGGVPQKALEEEVEEVELENPKTIETSIFHNFKAKIKRLFEEWNPSSLVNRMWELKAVLDLAKVYNAAVNYYNTKGVVPWEIAQLVRANYLPKSYLEKIRGKYIFSLNEEGKEFAVYADPVDDSSGLRHFYVGESAIIRYEIGKQAGPESPPHDY